MYSTNQPKSPLVAGQEVPATGIPIASPNQQYHPPPPTTQSTYVQSPAPVGHQQHAAAGTRVGRWSTGLFDCFSDVPNCCITFWCPCITFGQIAEIVDQGSTSCGVSGALYAVLGWVTGCACLYSCFYRSKLRSQYMLEDGPCCDCCVHFCCEACALCQEYRELKSRGFDMSLGWHGNMTRMQNQQQGMAPPPTAPMVEMGMKR